MKLEATANDVVVVGVQDTSVFELENLGSVTFRFEYEDYHNSPSPADFDAARATYVADMPRRLKEEAAKKGATHLRIDEINEGPKGGYVAIVTGRGTTFRAKS